MNDSCVLWDHAPTFMNTKTFPYPAELSFPLIRKASSHSVRLVFLVFSVLVCTRQPSSLPNQVPEFPFNQAPSSSVRVSSVRVFLILSLLRFEFPVPSSRVSSVQAFPSFAEQPVQLNTVPIYICVYTHSLYIPSLRIFDLINNKLLFRCSVVHSHALNK